VPTLRVRAHLKLSREVMWVSIPASEEAGSPAPFDELADRL
jgi:hypothetical protein